MTMTSGKTKAQAVLLDTVALLSRSRRMNQTLNQLVAEYGHCEVEEFRLLFEIDQHMARVAELDSATDRQASILQARARIAEAQRISHLAQSKLKQMQKNLEELLASVDANERQGQELLKSMERSKPT